MAIAFLGYFRPGVPIDSLPKSRRRIAIKVLFGKPSVVNSIFYRLFPEVNKQLVLAESDEVADAVPIEITGFEIVGLGAA